MEAALIENAVGELLALPRTEQPAALDALLAGLPPEPSREAWNTRFGSGSLFEAWTRTTVASGVHDAIVGRLRPVLSRPGWRVVEIGGGNGRLWERALRPADRGELVVVDPVPDVHEEVARRLPAGVRLTRVVTGVETLGALPEADAVVCSLTLHHVAGRDASERAAHGLTGPGKREVLERIRQAIRPRGGRLLLAEADVHCDLGLPPGDPILVDRLLDSYVRRCGRAILDDIARRADADEDLRARWRAVLRHWCLEQVAVAQLPVEERDVYELTVPRWRALLAEAGLELERWRFTDRYGLFASYVARAPA